MLHELEYAGRYLAQSICFCGSVDTDEDELGLHDCLVHVRGEEEVVSPAGLHHLVQTRLKHRCSKVKDSDARK